MNNWHNEFMAEYHRQDLIEVSDQIRIEKLAIHSRIYSPGLFARIMFNIGSWMITRGKQLRKRYEIPTAGCSQTPSSSYAH